ncbi:cupin domain-containing protein [Legionella dresdenensis]|uniref:Cupin domain-containing protein n=1 Tax=Legionella dresdenensis TaxID=450200 RepID=A0ABV8CGN1_9GAMM
MINFQEMTVNEFLTEYWQKKFLVIRNALPDFVNPINADELAGLALEEEIESRLVLQQPGKNLSWNLKRGPFEERDFQKLPASHWTLLVQGVDRFVPEVADLLGYFHFLPQWRFDDVMISYAVTDGGVGPHYDHYDVFLFQAQGRRKWQLSTKNCRLDNYQEGLDLRIMKQFDIEQEIILEPGDMLYLPPHVAHNGIALSDDCMTYSFGYRSYEGQELWDSFGEHLAGNANQIWYRDPDWSGIKSSAELPQTAWLQAKNALQQLLDDEENLKKWFGCFATSIDRHAESILPMPLEADEIIPIEEFRTGLLQAEEVIKSAVCRFAFIPEGSQMKLFINGCEWDNNNITTGLVRLVAEHNTIAPVELKPYLGNDADLEFLYELWKLQWLEIVEK